VRVFTVCAVTAVSLAAAAVCAGEAAAATKAEFIRRGDAACIRAARELAPLARRARAAQALPEAKRWTAATSIWSAQIRVQVRFNRRLRAIGAPPGDAQARRILRELDRGVALARRVRTGFARRDAAALSRALPAYITFTNSLNARVRAYGFRRCGRT
jgi:hypothetical protein